VKSAFLRLGDPGADYADATWDEVRARAPDLRPPLLVVEDYLTALRGEGFLANGPDGLLHPVAARVTRARELLAGQSAPERRVAEIERLARDVLRPLFAGDSFARAM